METGAFLTAVLTLFLLNFGVFTAPLTEGEVGKILGVDQHVEFQWTTESPFHEEGLHPPLKYIEVLLTPDTRVPSEPSARASLAELMVETFARDAANSSQLAGFFFDSSNTKVAELVPAIDACLTARGLGRMQRVQLDDEETVRYAKAFKHQVVYKGGYVLFKVAEKAPAMPEESPAGKLLYYHLFEYGKPRAASDRKTLVDYMLAKMTLLRLVCGEETSGYWFQGPPEEVGFLVKVLSSSTQHRLEQVSEQGPLHEMNGSVPESPPTIYYHNFDSRESSTPTTIAVDTAAGIIDDNKHNFDSDSSSTRTAVSKDQRNINAWHFRFEATKESPFGKNIDPPLIYLRITSSHDTPKLPIGDDAEMRRLAEMVIEAALAQLKKSEIAYGGGEEEDMAAGFFFEGGDVKLMQLKEAIDGYLVKNGLGQLEAVVYRRRKEENNNGEGVKVAGGGIGGGETKTLIHYIKALKHVVFRKTRNGSEDGYVVFEVALRPVITGVTPASISEGDTDVNNNNNCNNNNDCISVSTATSSSNELYYHIVRAKEPSDKNTRQMAKVVLAKMRELRTVEEGVVGYWFGGRAEEVQYLVDGFEEYYKHTKGSPVSPTITAQGVLIYQRRFGSGPNVPVPNLQRLSKKRPHPDDD